MCGLAGPRCRPRRVVVADHVGVVQLLERVQVLQGGRHVVVRTDEQHHGLVPDVDHALDVVGERRERADEVVPVGAQVEREVVSRPGGNADGPRSRVRSARAARAALPPRTPDSRTAGRCGGSASRQPYRNSRAACSLTAAAARGVAAGWQQGATESCRHIERRE
jgi:hypothetical protein